MFRSRIVYLLFTWSVCLASATGQVPKSATPLEVRDVLDLRSFSSRMPIDISPDGEWIAYTLESQSEHSLVDEERYSTYSRTGASPEANGSFLCITNIASGRTRRLVPVPARSWGGSWSPDSHLLAFYSDRGGQIGLWVWDRVTNKPRRVSTAIPRPFFGFEVPQWTPDSRKVLIKLLPEDLTIERAAELMMPVPVGDKGKSPHSKIAVYSWPEEKQTDNNLSERTRLSPYLTGLGLIDVATGSIKRIATHHTVASYFLSPDGSSVAFMDYKGLEAESSQQPTYDITIASISTGSVNVVAERVRMNYGTSAGWSPGGRHFAYITAGQLAKGDCYVVDTHGSEPRNITIGEHPNFGDAGGHYRVPVWSKNGDKIYSIADGRLWEISMSGDRIKQVATAINRDIVGIVTYRGTGRTWSPNDDSDSLYVITREKRTRNPGFYKIDVGNDQAAKLIENSRDVTSTIFFVDVSSGTIAYVSEDSQSCEDIWIAESDVAKPRRLTHINPQLDKYKMGQTRLIEWKTEDGQIVEGALLLPADFEARKRYPLIVDVYGGLRPSNSVNRFGVDATGNAAGVANNQLLATRGYAVFMPDIPLRMGTPMRDMARIVLPGVDRVIELGFADPNRLGIKGVSYGGYCTLALISQSTRFKAALIRSSTGSSLFAFYGVMAPNGKGQWTGWAENGQGRMGGTPWEMRDRYIENSPYFYLDRVTTPLMITAGTADSSVPPFLMDEIFVALQRLEKPVTYVKYEGGDHGESSLDSESATDYFNRTVAWFDKYLKAPEPSRQRLRK